MKSKSVRKLAALCLTLATLFLTGCGQSEQAREAERLQAISEGLDTANRLLFSGQTDQALDTLETLDQSYPNTPEVLEALAFAYAKKPDHALAAFYFDTVVQLDSSRADLALYAARSHAETGDTASAARAYQVYLQDSAEDAAAWRALAEALTIEQKNKPALDAWLESLKLSGAKPGALDAATIGRLYLSLDNLPQAKRWFEASLQAPAQADSRKTALLGLIEINLREKQWAAAETRIAELDKVDLAALDNSPMASARLELKKWREAQATLAKQTAAAQIASAADAKPENTEKKPNGTITVDRTGETISLTEDNSMPPALDKSLPPAHAQEEGMASSEESSEEPVENSDGTIAPTPLADGSNGTETETPVQAAEPETPAETPKPTITASSLRERADLAYESENYNQAIALYQAALAQEPNAAPIYYGLSRCYYQQQKWPQAEMYASEAMRLSPNDLRYTVNFLRCIQRTQSAERLMAEMVRAKERFPDSPDITLALARGYERLMNNRRNAIFLYQEFLTMAPGHPQAEEVRQHLNTL